MGSIAKSESPRLLALQILVIREGVVQCRFSITILHYRPLTQYLACHGNIFVALGFGPNGAFDFDMNYAGITGYDKITN
jgi:hypothetical protein